MASGSVAISPFVNYGGYVKDLDTLFDSGYGWTNAATGQPYATNGMVVVFNARAIAMQLYIPYYSPANPLATMYRIYAKREEEPYDYFWSNWANLT